MQRTWQLLPFFSLLLILMWPPSVAAQAGSGTLAGSVKDAAQGVLPGARVILQPGNITAVSDAQGKFSFNSIAPGAYTATVSYVGFAQFESSITVVAGQGANLNAVLQVASQSQNVVVTAERAHGEAEAINEERTTENILDVLPAKVITSLPNANIADAVGRLPGVTLERDEGEGKYVQIRGTEPRLSNLTIDGITLPSPEGAVRQVKLDTIPAGLVQSVQIYKTLEADQPGDAIGGSVNLETRTAGDSPTLSLYGMGGFTPIVGTVPVGEFGGTIGKRFGVEKRLGFIFSGSWDYNGRGIDDIEPIPTIQTGTTFTPGFSSMDIREYAYDRKRYGFGANADYKLGSSSTLFIRTLFSNFKDYGHRYDYALATNDTTPGPNVPSFTTERRLGDYGVTSLILGGAHTINQWNFQWDASVARSRMLNPINGGESITTFNYLPPGTDPVNSPPTSNCQYDPAATKSRYRPQFTAACMAEAYNPANFQLASIADSAHGLAAQLNLQGAASASRSYSSGSVQGVFQGGVYVSNAHKFDNSYENDYTPNNPVLMSSFVDNFKNSNYYGGSYQFGPGISWEKANAFLAANRSAFTPSSTYGGNSNNFDLIERVSAGYLMNSLQLGRFTVITGVRVEGTQDDTLSFDTTVNTLSLKGSNSYVNVLPSAELITRLPNNSDIKLAYGRGISRPDPQFLTTATSLDSSTFPPTLTIGNPALKPELANNYDALFEKYLTPIGLIRAGFFYKSLSAPIVTLLSLPSTGPYVGYQVSQAANAGTAHIAGLELSFQQHFTYFPGLMSGLGLSANYSYASSQANNVNPGNRTDSPALLRTAPQTWNISPTFDRGRVSLRVGLSYNGPSIYQYSYADGATGGIRGPGGDVYLFSHFQVDAQGTYNLGKGWSLVASGLNLNNEPFGFYMGSPEFFIQREYYQATYSFGFRWDKGQRQ